MNAAEKISKLDAASRQLRTAIHLFLSGGDMIAVHTLAAASLGVLGDLGAKRGFPTLLRHPEARIQPDKLKEVVALFNAPQNFFKHADKDPEGVLDFYPESTPFLIVDAVMLCHQLGGSAEPACKAFFAWFSFNYPDTLAEGETKELAVHLSAQDPSVRDRQLALRLLKRLEEEATLPT